MSALARRRIMGLPQLLSWLFVPLTRRRGLSADLDEDQMKDAGISWELLGYGRGACVSMLAYTIAQSRR